MVQKTGYNAFSYGLLSLSVGIKTSSIHYHFPSKEHLGEALVRRYRERFAVVLEQIEAKHADAPARIGSYAEQFMQTLRPGGTICLCGMLASDYVTLPESVRREVRAFFAENEAWLTRILEDGRESGAFNFNSDAKDVAATFLSTLEGAMLGARLFDDKSRLRRAIVCWQNFLLVEI